jgi:hypothetical protein
MHIRHVMENYPSTIVYSERFRRYERHWIGTDTRNRTLEIFATERSGYFEVFHAMPYWYRNR